MEDFVTPEATISEQEPELTFPEDQAGDAFSLEIKYNGENKTLTREQAVTLAQKGMNYDHVKEQLEKLKNAPENDLSLRRFSELRDELDAMRAREIAEKKWAEFRENHTEYASFAALPEEVRARVAAGTELEAAYALYENKMLKTRLGQLEQNLKNREAAPGSLGSSGKGEAADDFLKGFLGI